MAVHWFPLALERVEEIAEYIAEDNPEAAAHWVNELFNTVDRLNDFPISGRVVPETNVRHGSQLLSEDALEDETWPLPRAIQLPRAKRWRDIP